MIDLLTASTATLTLLVAGPGYGKTVALSQWLDTLACTRAWISLDSYDDSPRMFWRCVVEAVRRAAGGVGTESAQMLEQDAALQSVLTRFLVELDELEQPMLLTLDDLHVIRSEELMDQLVSFVEQLPPEVRIVASTRVDPMLPLGRWRASGVLNELREAELKFDRNEVTRLLASRRTPSIAVVDQGDLLELTEGWAVGLQLALLSYEGNPEPTEYVRSALAGDRLITDYLVSEVLDRLTEEDRTLIFDLSILHDFDSSLAVAVTSNPDAGNRIRSLEERGLFILPVDKARQRFRFHQLFREFLQHELRWRAPERIPNLHRRAAEHFVAEAEVQSAVRHLVAAEDVDAAYQLVAATAWRHLDLGDVGGARHQLDTFGRDFVGSDVDRILDYMVLSAAAGRLGEAASWAARLEAQSVHRPLTPAQNLRNVAQRAQIEYIRGDLEASELSALHCLDLLGGQPFEGTPVHRLVAFLVRQAIDRGDLAEARRWMPFVADLTSDSNVLSHLIPQTLAARLAWAEGALTEAEDAAREVISHCDRGGLAGVRVLGEANFALAGVLHETGRLKEAEEVAVAAVEIGYESDIPLLEVSARVLLVSLMTTCLGPLAGLAALDTTRRTFAGRYIGDRVTAMLDEAECRLRLLQGDSHGARRLLAGLGSSRQRDLLAARTHISAGRLDEAVHAVGDPDLGTMEHQIEASILLAHSTESAVSVEHLHRAMSLGVSRGYFHIYAREGVKLVSDLRRVCAERPSTELGELLERLDPGTGAAEHSVFIEPLTDRETALLELLPTHLTYREVANELCLSHNTVKTYQKSVFRKLGATSRSDAVAIARSKGLISQSLR